MQVRGGTPCQANSRQSRITHCHNHTLPTAHNGGLANQPDLSGLNISTNTTLVGHSGVASDMVELRDILRSASWKSIRRAKMWGKEVVVKHWIKEDMFSTMVSLLSFRTRSLD